MIIEASKYNGMCSCGKEHVMATEFCVVEAGCLKRMETYLERFGLTGPSTAVYDENTYKAAGDSRPKADREIVLNPEGLHANEHGVDSLLAQLSDETQVLIAVGAGTIHDIVRYCAYRKGIPFVSCPTAASVDGFCSSVAAMTFDGCKKTLTTAAPKIVVADLDIISKAPMFLAKSGFGDMAGKVIALADWKISSVLTGEFYCARICDMTSEATNAVLKSVQGIASGEISAYEQLMSGLLLSGLAMQMMGNSRPASGAEHHISHFIETSPAEFGIYSDALHGEKVGVATILASEEYHRLAEEDICWKDYPDIEPDEIFAVFGEQLGGQLAAENKNDAAGGITKEKIEMYWQEICGIIREIPTARELRDLYQLIGAKATLSDIDVPETAARLLLNCSPCVRNRMTLMRLRRAIK